MNPDAPHPVIVNQTAFPHPLEADHWGLLKREYFAARALQGLLSNAKNDAKNGYDDLADYAHDAVKLADLLIEALNERGES